MTLQSNAIVLSVNLPKIKEQTIKLQQEEWKEWNVTDIVRSNLPFGTCSCQFRRRLQLMVKGLPTQQSSQR